MKDLGKDTALVNFLAIYVDAVENSEEVFSEDCGQHFAKALLESHHHEVCRLLE